MAWLYLIVAGFLEMSWTIGMKYSHGFTRVGPSVLTCAGLIGSMWLLALAVRELPIGTAYAVWVGIGAVGTAILGMILFNEPRGAWRMLCLVLIVAGIAGLKLTHRAPAP